MSNKDDKPSTIDDLDFNAEPKRVQCPSCASFTVDHLIEEETCVCAACGKQWRIINGKVVCGNWIK